MNRWCVAETQPRAETKALWHLERQGFVAYLPQYLKRRRHARRTDWVRAPLFPRYLFVALDTARMRWRAINSTVGIARLVCNGDAPSVVPVGVVEDIRAREDQNGFVRLPHTEPFQKYEKVRVISGPLADAVGVFQCATDSERVVLLLELLGRRIEVRMPLHSVTAAA